MKQHIDRIHYKLNQHFNSLARVTPRKLGGKSSRTEKIEKIDSLNALNAEIIDSERSYGRERENEIRETETRVEEVSKES